MAYKGLTKSRKNTSNRPSAAKKQAAKVKERLKTGTVHKTKKARGGTERVAKGMPYRLKRMEAMPVRQLPTTPYTVKGKTLRQLIRSTPRLFINNAVNVEARSVEVKYTATKRPAVRGKMVTIDPHRTGRVRRVHESYIVGMDEDTSKPVNRHRKVLVQCTCENFVYVFEYANATVGASRLIYSNGEPPVFTNPQLLFGCCKHIIALAKIIIEKDT